MRLVSLIWYLSSGRSIASNWTQPDYLAFPEPRHGGTEVGEGSPANQALSLTRLFAAWEPGENPGTDGMLPEQLVSN